jgi:hypothetical protein
MIMLVLPNDEPKSYPLCEDIRSLLAFLRLTEDDPEDAVESFKPRVSTSSSSCPGSLGQDGCSAGKLFLEGWNTLEETLA